MSLRVCSICAVVCPLAGNFLTNCSLRLPFGTQALLWLGNIALVASLPETAPKRQPTAADNGGGWRESLRTLQPLSVFELFRRGPRLRLLACAHVLNEMTEARSLYQVTDLARAQVLGWGMEQRSRFSSCVQLAYSCSTFTATDKDFKLIRFIAFIAATISIDGAERRYSSLLSIPGYVMAAPLLARWGEAASRLGLAGFTLQQLGCAHTPTHPLPHRTAT